MKKKLGPNRFYGARYYFDLREVAAYFENRKVPRPGTSRARKGVK